jgi:fibronectin type 3 domain-containing protein
MQDDDNPITTTNGSGVTLEWDANTEPDLAGYKVYYKTGSSGAPYDGTGATEGDSPIDVSDVTTYTLHGQAEGVAYFFVVTAYDTEGLESDYSNEVTIN